MKRDDAKAMREVLQETAATLQAEQRDHQARYAELHAAHLEAQAAGEAAENAVYESVLPLVVPDNG